MSFGNAFGAKSPFVRAVSLISTLCFLFFAISASASVTLDNESTTGNYTLDWNFNSNYPVEITENGAPVGAPGQKYNNPGQMNFNKTVNGDYVYHVFPCELIGQTLECPSGNAVEKTITVNIPPPVPPAQPTVSVNPSSYTGNFSVIWNDVPYADSYQWSERANGSANWSDWAVATSAEMSALSLDLVRTTGEYEFRMQACNTYGCSGPGNTDAITVNAPVTSPEYNYSLDDQSFLPDVSAPDFVATTAGNLNISGGTARYSVPIALPPAINGTKPKLALSYNSSGRSGLAGLGWNISGLSSISRCRASYDTEGAVKVAQANARFTQADRLCLDGEKLVVSDNANPSDSQYWSGSVDYRTELDSFSRVEPVGTYLMGPSTFKVYGRNGLIYTYGEEGGQNARVLVTAGGNDHVSSWMLSQVEDRYGNSYEVNYIRNTATGEFYPQNITFAPGAEVVFNYTDRDLDAAGDPADVPWGYDTGHKYQTLKILTGVTTFIKANTGSPEAVFDYQIAHTRSPVTGRYLVDTITQCGYDEFGAEQCARPLEFDWQLGEIGFESTVSNVLDCSSGSPITFNSNNTLADFNRDSYNDILDRGMPLYFGTASGCFNSVYVTNANTKPADIQGGNLMRTRNGYATLLLNTKTTNGSTPAIYVVTYNGLTATYQPLVTGTSIVGDDKEYRKPAVADFNNDGLDDIFFEGKLWLQNDSTTVSFTAQANETTMANNVDFGQLTAIDFNSDGLLDIAANHLFPLTGSSDTGYVKKLFINQGDGSFDLLAGSPVYIWGDYPSSWLIGDFNGDAKTDFGAWYNTGAGDTIANFGPIGSYTLDYNRDGISDIVMNEIISGGPDYEGATKEVRVKLLQYDNGNMIRVDAGTPFYTHSADFVNNSFTSTTNLIIGDLNNDGVSDYRLGKDILFGKRGQPDLLKRVTNGFGAYSEITYDTLHSEDHIGQPFYTPLPASPNFPYMQVGRSSNMVKTVATSNGVGGEIRQHYHYAGGRVHTRGRGFQGFEKITVTNESTGVQTISNFIQDYPYTGLNSHSETKESSTGYLISRSQTEYETHPVNNRFIYSRAVIQQSYGLTSTDSAFPLSVKKTENIYDEYGNLDFQTVEVGTGLKGLEVTGKESITTLDNTIVNNLTEWLLGFIEQSETQFSDGDGQNTRTVINQAFPEPGTLDVRETRNHVGTAIQSHMTTVRNSYGVVTSVFSDALDMFIEGGWADTRTQGFFNFEDTMYPTVLMNAKNHPTTVNYDKRFGSIHQTIDANNLTSTQEYDVLGRIVKTIDTNSVETKSIAFYCETGPVTCPANAVYYNGAISTHAAANDDLGAPLTFTFYDSLQREIRTQGFGLGGSTIVDTEYDAQGRIDRVSEPYIGDNPSYWTTYHNYDVLGRPGRIEKPDGGAVDYTYTREGSKSKTVQSVTVQTPSNSHTQNKTTFVNALGQVVRVEDAQDIPVPTTYAYDTQGNLVSTIVDGNSDTAVLISHDEAGNKVAIQDPNAGSITYYYNGYGELRMQVHAPGTTDEKLLMYQYDELGRTVFRSDIFVNDSSRNLAYAWVWDNGKIGMLDAHMRDGFMETYYYNHAAQLVSVVIDAQIDGAGRIFQFSYDAFGREKTVYYGADLTVIREYHAMGEHVRTSTMTPGSTAPTNVWTLGNHIDERGNYTHQLLGNGVVTEKIYDDTNGLLSNIYSGKGTQGNIQALSYTFDSIGNLYTRQSQRTDANGTAIENLYEGFLYDKLNRLISSSLFSNAASTCGDDYCYDRLGNLTFKSGTGILTYDQSGNAGVHAITQGNGKTYQYDVFGNVIQRGSQILEFDAFNKPTKIGDTEFHYDANHTRYKQVDNSNNITTFYMMGRDYQEIYEGTVSPSNLTKRINIDGLFEYEIKPSSTEMTYLHYDHLGSVEAMTDANGQYIERMSFDPWGERIFDDWSAGNPTAGSSLFYNTQRGYTGHEQLDHLDGLVHMNGRVYDSIVGRMLSADPVVSDPYNGQRYNRYSYVLNNPLSFIDPTGYSESFHLAGLNNDPKYFLNFQSKYMGGAGSSDQVIGGSLGESFGIIDGWMLTIWGIDELSPFTAKATLKETNKKGLVWSEESVGGEITDVTMPAVTTTTAFDWSISADKAKSTAESIGKVGSFMRSVMINPLGAVVGGVLISGNFGDSADEFGCHPSTTICNNNGGGTVQNGSGVGLVGGSANVYSGGPEDPDGPESEDPFGDKLKAQLRLDQKISQGKIHTSGGSLQLGQSSRAAIFDANSGQLYVGQTNHIGVAQAHGLRIESGRLVGGWVQVSRSGTIRFTHGSGSFPGGQVQNLISQNIDDLIRGIGIRVTNPL